MPISAAEEGGARGGWDGASPRATPATDGSPGSSSRLKVSELLRAAVPDCECRPSMTSSALKGLDSQQVGSVIDAQDWGSGTWVRGSRPGLRGVCSHGRRPIAFPEQESYSSSGHHKVCRFVIDNLDRCGSCDSQGYCNVSVTDKQSASRIPRYEWLRTNTLPQQALSAPGILQLGHSRWNHENQHQADLTKHWAFQPGFLHACRHRPNHAHASTGHRCSLLRYISSVCLTRTGEDDRWIAANRI